MLTKKGGIIIASFVAFLSICSVAYLSCTKPAANPFSCNGVVCQNGGYCDSSHCICPNGYEGVNCGTPIVDKYIGKWSVVQKTIGSDSLKAIGVDSVYGVELMRSATPTTFFISDLAGDPNYNDIVCLIDSTDNYNFAIDTGASFRMWYDHFQMSYGYGRATTPDTIKISMAVRHLTSTVNWQRDTLSLTLSKRH